MEKATRPAWEDISAAQRRIAPHAHRTPVFTSRYFNERSGASLFFKCENLQRTGSFKARGALNAVFSLDEHAARAGVATHSSGNHGQALSYAAAQRGIKATIVMPENAPAAKRQAVEAYGGKVVTCAAGNKAREAMLAKLLAESGAHAVHPFADPHVIAGQGTAAAELLEETGGLDCVLAPIGGGGLLSGTCIALSHLAPKTRIFGAEPELADDAHRSMEAGRLVPGADVAPTIADGLRASLKQMTWKIISTFADRILLASEEEIIETMLLFWQRTKLIIEPSSAVAVAALLREAELFKGQRVGIILSGGNVDLSRLPWQGVGSGA